MAGPRSDRARGSLDQRLRRRGSKQMIGAVDEVIVNVRAEALHRAWEQACREILADFGPVARKEIRTRAMALLLLRDAENDAAASNKG